MLDGVVHYSTVVPLPLAPIAVRLEPLLRWSEWCSDVVDCCVPENQSPPSQSPSSGLIRRTRLAGAASGKVLREQEFALRSSASSLVDIAFKILPLSPRVLAAASALLEPSADTAAMDDATKQQIRESVFASPGGINGVASAAAGSLFPINLSSASWSVRASLLTDAVVGTEGRTTAAASSSPGFRSFVEWHTDVAIGDVDAGLVQRASASKQFLEAGETTVPAAVIAGRVKKAQLQLVKQFMLDYFVKLQNSLWRTVMLEAFPVDTYRRAPLSYRSEHEELEPKIIAALVNATNRFDEGEGASPPAVRTTLRATSELLEKTMRSWEVLARDNEAKALVIQQLLLEVEASKNIAAASSASSIANPPSPSAPAAGIRPIPASAPAQGKPLVASRPGPGSAVNGVVYRPANNAPGGGVTYTRVYPHGSVLFVSSVTQTDPVTAAEPPRPPFYSQRLRDAVSTGVFLRDDEMQKIFEDLDSTRVGYVTDREIKALLLTLEHFGSYEDKTGVTTAAEQCREDLQDPSFVEKKIAVLEQGALKRAATNGASSPPKNPAPALQRGNSSNAILVPLSPRVHAQTFLDQSEDALQRRHRATFDVMARRWVDRYSRREKGKIFFEEFVLFVLQLCRQ